MEENTRIEELKSYLNTKEANNFISGLIVVFYMVAALITLIILATGATPFRVFCAVILWGVAIITHVVSVRELGKTRVKDNGLPEGEEARKAVLDDFDKAVKIHNDNLRMGEKYVYARKGGMTPYADIRKAGARRLPLQEATFIQFYIELASGRQAVIYQEEEAKVHKGDIEGIIFYLAAHTPGIKFNK